MQDKELYRYLLGVEPPWKVNYPLSIWKNDEKITFEANKADKAIIEDN